MSKLTKEQKQIQDVMANCQLLRQKLQIAENALNDIKLWSADIEDEWGDPGERANAALEKIMVIDGF